MLAITLVDAIYGLVIALIAALPATGALYFGLRNNRQVEEMIPAVRTVERQTTEMAPQVKAIDNAVNQKPSAESPTLRETAEATHELAGDLKDQEAARVVERAEDKAERDGP